MAAKRPAAHFVHVDAAAAPIAALDLPAEHDVHDDEPAELAYVPCGQGRQSAALSPPI